MTPFGRNILIKPVEKQQTLVSDSPSLTDVGEVIAVGKDVLEIKVGDKVAYLFWGCNSVKIDDKDHFFITESDEFILGIV